MDSIYLYVFLISFIATLVRSTFGFGESLVAVPLFILFIPLNVAVPLSVLISIVVALVVVLQDHSQIHFQSAKWLIIYALLGIPIGVFMLLYGNDFWVKIGLGLIIISYSFYAIFARGKMYLETDSKLWLFVCGFLSGVLGGAYGVNGPPLVVYGNMRRWNAKQFRATLQAYFLPASFIGIVAYFFQDLITMEVIRYFAVSLPAIFPAIFFGRYLNHRLKDVIFFKFVYWGLLLIGIFLVCNAVFGKNFH